MLKRLLLLAIIPVFSFGIMCSNPQEMKDNPTLAQTCDGSNCSEASNSCAEIFKSGVGVTGNGILSLESKVKINNGGALLAAANSMCMPANSFGICEETGKTDCDSYDNCQSSGKANACLPARKIKAPNLTHTNITSGSPGSFSNAVKDKYNNTINEDIWGRWNLKGDDTYYLRGSNDPNNPKHYHTKQVYLTGTVANGSTLVVTGHAVIHTERFGYAKSANMGGLLTDQQKLHITSNSSLEIRTKTFQIGNNAEINVAGKLTVHAQENVIFDQGTVLTVDPDYGIAQFFGDNIYGGQSFGYNDNTQVATQQGAVYLNWFKIAPDPSTNTVSECTDGKINCLESNAKGLALYANNIIRLHDGSKVKGLLYSASSQDFYTYPPDKNGGFVLHGTAYCSEVEQQRCVEENWRKLTQECQKRVDDCYHARNDVFEACMRRKSALGQLGLVSWTKEREACRIEAQIPTDITYAQYDRTLVAAFCREQEGLPLQAGLPTTDARLLCRDKYFPYITNLCTQEGTGLTSISYNPVGDNFLAVSYVDEKCKVKMMCRRELPDSQLSNECKNDINRRDNQDLPYGVQLKKGVEVVGAVTSKYVNVGTNSNILFDKNSTANTRAEDLCHANLPPVIQNKNFSLIGKPTEKDPYIGNINAYDPDGGPNGTRGGPIYYTPLKDIERQTQAGKDYFEIDSNGNVKMTKAGLANTKTGVVYEFYVTARDADGGETTELVQYTACNDDNIVNVNNSPSGKFFTRISNEPFGIKIGTGCSETAKELTQQDANISFNLGFYDQAGNKVQDLGDFVLNKNNNYNIDKNITVENAYPNLQLKATNLKINGATVTKRPTITGNTATGETINSTDASNKFSIRPKRIAVPFETFDGVSKEEGGGTKPPLEQIKDPTTGVTKLYAVAGRTYKVKVKAETAQNYINDIPVLAQDTDSKNLKQEALKIEPSENQNVVQIRGDKAVELDFTYNGIGAVDLNFTDKNYTKIDQSIPDKDGQFTTNNCDPKITTENTTANGQNCSLYGNLCSCYIPGNYPVSFIPADMNAELNITNTQGTKYGFFGDITNPSLLRLFLHPVGDNNLSIINYSADINYTISPVGTLANSDNVALVDQSDYATMDETTKKKPYLLEKELEFKNVPTKILGDAAQFTPATTQRFEDIIEIPSTLIQGGNAVMADMAYNFKRDSKRAVAPLKLTHSDFNITVRDGTSPKKYTVKINTPADKTGGIYGILYIRANPQDYVAVGADATPLIYYEAYSPRKTQLAEVLGGDHYALSPIGVNWWVIPVPDYTSADLKDTDFTRSDNGTAPSVAKLDKTIQSQNIKVYEVTFPKPTTLPIKTKVELDLSANDKKFLFYHPYQDKEEEIFYLHFKEEKKPTTQKTLSENKEPKTSKGINRLGR